MPDQPSSSPDEKIDNLSPVLITATAIAVTATICFGAVHLGEFVFQALLP